MPEYLAPGVYVEEVSFRAKPIEGVPTTTTGYVGMARTGPVYYAGGPSSCTPRLITNFTEFERVYGGLDDVASRTNYLGHAVRAFFENGGRRLYVSRVFAPTGGGDIANDIASSSASPMMNDANGVANWQARWPGSGGNVLVTSGISRSGDVAIPIGTGFGVRGVKSGSVVEIFSTPPSSLPDASVAPTLSNLRVVEIDADGNQTFWDSSNTNTPPGSGDLVQLVQLTVRIDVPDGRVLEFADMGAHDALRRSITTILDKDDPEDEDCPVFLDWTPGNSEAFQPARLLEAVGTSGALRLAGGRDGDVINATQMAGSAADPDDESIKATGLEALAELEDISIVAAPDAGSLVAAQAEAAAGALISHAEAMRYRIAVIDPPEGSSLTEVRAFRGKFDSTRAAVYYPWLEVLDPAANVAQGAPPPILTLPPSGFVTGIYARNDITRGVHKAPANEVIRGISGFEVNVTSARQEVLNPENINALRFFEGRGNRVWGARTMTSDGEWKYVNVRRLFNFIERSIDVGTQYAVFEPNGPRLWGKIRRSIEDFLLVLWKQGALLGQKAEDAYFVRCDRSTMTQNDLDNGRLVCLIGIAPVKPAEFVIFRIGQITSDAKN